MSMCPQYSASSRVLIFPRIARWRSTSRYIGVSRKSRVPLVRGRFLPFVMPTGMGWDCVNVWRERVMNCSCWRRRPAVRPSTRSLREPGSMRSRLVQYELDGRSLLARGHVALHSMVQEDIDHLPHGCAGKFCCLPESDLPVAVEADRILRRSERNELTRSGRLVQVLSPCDRFHGLEQGLGDPEAADGAHGPFLSMAALASAYCSSLMYSANF